MAISSTLIKSFQLSTLATALALAGCGGGSGNDTLQPGLPTGTNPMPSPGNGTGTNPAPGNGTGTNPTKPAQKFDVKAVNLTSPTPTFDIKVGNKINVTASVLNSANTGIGGVPVVFEIIEDPAKTGVYAISDTNNIITNANGEATIQLEVKSEEFATKLSQGLTIKATAQNNSGDKLVPISQVEPFKLLGKVVETNTPSTNIAQQVKNIALTSPTPEFDFVVGQKITVTATATNEKGGIVSNAPINFDLGSLADTGVVSTSPSTRNTDAQGQATIELEVKDASQAMRNKIANGLLVKAAVEGSTLPPKTLTLKPRTVVEDTHKTVSSITVKQDSPLYLAKGSKVKISAFALNDLFGGLAGKQLTFRLDKNPEISGVYNNSNSIITTLANGEATVELEVKTDLTTAQKNDLKTNGIKITVSDVDGNKNEVVLKGQETSQTLVDKVVLETASKMPIVLATGTEFNVVAHAFDSNYGIIENTAITFKLPDPAISGIVSLSPSTVATDKNGSASIQLRILDIEKAKQYLTTDYTITPFVNNNAKDPYNLRLFKSAKPSDNIDSISLSKAFDKFNAKTGERFSITASVLNIGKTGVGGIPVSFVLEDPNITGIYAVSDTSNVITSANGEATIELEVKDAEKAKKYLSVLVTAKAISTASGDPQEKSIPLTIKGIDPSIAAAEPNIAKVSQGAITTSLANNIFDLSVGTTFDVITTLADAKQGALSKVPVTFSLPGLEKTGIANLSGSTVTTDVNGKATIKLRIDSLNADQRKELLTNGLTINATVPNSTVIKPLKLTARDAGVDTLVQSIQVTADRDDMVMIAGSRVRVTASALTGFFGGINGADLTFKITDPKLTNVFNITGDTVKTDGKGEASIDLELKAGLTAEQRINLAKGIDVTVISANGTQGTLHLKATDVPEVKVDKVVLEKFPNMQNYVQLVQGNEFIVLAHTVDANNGAVVNTPVTFNLPNPRESGIVSLSPSTVMSSTVDAPVDPKIGATDVIIPKGTAYIRLRVIDPELAKKYLAKGFPVTGTYNNGKNNFTHTVNVMLQDTKKASDNVDSISLSKAFDKFNAKTGERFSITASVLNIGKTGVGGIPVSFVLEDPNITGIYAVSDTSNVITSANGEATIELEVKDAEKAKKYLSVLVTAKAISTASGDPQEKSIPLTIKGIDPSIAAAEPNIAKVSQGAITTSLANNIFDLSVGTTFDVITTLADAKQGALSKVPVTFSLPGLEKTGIANLSGSTVTTDVNGKATIKLRIDSLNADQRKELLTNGLTINATVPNSTVIKPLKLTARDAGVDTLVTSIVMTSDRNDILMAAGTKVHVTASALNGNFGGVPATDLTFTIPDPILTNVFNISGTVIKTNEKGEASIDLEVKSFLTQDQRDYLQKGLTVKVTTPSGATGEITLQAKAVNEVTIDKVVLEAFPNTPIQLSQGNEFIVMAHAVDAQNGAVVNAPITFNLPDPAKFGIVSLSPSTVLTSEQDAPVVPKIGASEVIIPKGTAYIRLRVIDPEKAKQLLASGYAVNAKSNGKVSQPLNVSVSEVKAPPSISDVAKVNVTTNLNTLTTNNGDTINVTAQVRDINNVSLANMPVTFELLDPTAATGVTATTPLQAKTNADGEAVLTLKVGALTPDQKYYLQTSGLSFKATAGSITSSTVTLKTQESITANSVSSLLLTTDSAVQLAVGAKVKVTALAMDKNGAVVPNAQVSFKVPTDSGLVNNTGAVVNTNINGEAVIEVEVKDLAKATTALQNGLVVNAQSGVSVGTTTILSATSQSATQAYNVFVSKSKDELKTGTDSLTMTIRVTDTKGGIKSNVPVYLQILEDGIARGLSFNKVSTLKTDDKGLVTVDLSQNDIGLVSRLNGTGKINVIVNDGIYRAEKEEISIPITGTTVDNLFVSNKEISATTNSTISATALDGSGKPFANTKVELLLNGNSLATPKFVSTDAQGKFTFTAAQAELGQAANYPLSVRLFGNNAQGVEISSSPIALTELKTVSQTETKLEVRANNVLMANNEILVNTTGQITILRPKDKAGNLLADGSKVYLSTNKGTLNGQGTRVEGTVTNNQVTFSINSPVANTANLVLEYNGEPVFTDSMSFLTKDVANPLILQLERTTLSTNGETNVISIVKDSNGLPVKNAIVEFSLVKDPSGGRLEKGYAITDDSGNATVKYFSGRTPTANDAVEIQANVGKIQINGKEENTNLSIKSDIKKLTVQTNATFIGFGFADKIRQHPDGRQIYYVYDGSIFVNNNIGQPAANQPVSVSIIPVQYLLGEYYVIPKVPAVPEVPEVKDDPTTPENEAKPAIPGKPEIPARWGIRHYDSFGTTTPGSVGCLSEDANKNGVLDSLEDANGNGKLDPINPATILAANGTEVVNGQTITTDSTGKLDFSIRYTKESADWWLGMIKVTTKVNGTEFVEYRTISLPTAVEDVSQPDATPPLRPNWISPFGNRTVFNGYTIINGKTYCQ